MAHYFESGFTVREPAWHGLGNVLDAHPDNWDDARMAAGLMWEPRLVPLFRRNVDADGNEVFVEAEGAKLVERDDTARPPAPEPSPSPELPVTGSGTVAAIVAAILLGAGGALVVLSRRGLLRRSESSTPDRSAT